MGRFGIFYYYYYYYYFVDRTNRLDDSLMAGGLWKSREWYNLLSWGTHGRNKLEWGVVGGIKNQEFCLDT